MKLSVIKIGNSKGFRLSKTLIEKYNIKDKIELTLEEDHIKLKPVLCPRKDWEISFKEMNKNGDDELLVDEIFEDESWEEW
jgi:antitoxin MazE